jgi:carboxypeptidase C (cathepsin A)
MKAKEIIKMTNDFEKIRKEVIENLTEDEWKKEAKYQLMGESYINQKILDVSMNTLNNKLIFKEEKD